jgi:hypothetical protein
MCDHSLIVPEYLKCILKRAENKMSKISDLDKNSDSVADGKSNQISEPVHQGVHITIPRKNSASDSVTSSKPEHLVVSEPDQHGVQLNKARKVSISHSFSDGKSDPPVISGSALQGLPVKVPRKNSIDNNVTMEVKTAAQSSKACPQKLNLTSLLGMKGVTKEAMVVPKKVHPTQQYDQKAPSNQQFNATPSWDRNPKPTPNQQFNTAPSWDRNPKPPPNQQFNNSHQSWDSNPKPPPNQHFNNSQSWDRNPKPPPNQQFNNPHSWDNHPKPPPTQHSHNTPSWESKNMCGWGDVQEIISKETSTTVQPIPTVREVFNYTGGKNISAKR